jgi:hypothetical protein
MLKKIKELFHQYRDYVRVDLVMYAVLILSIIVYFALTVLNVI